VQGLSRTIVLVSKLQLSAKQKTQIRYKWIAVLLFRGILDTVNTGGYHGHFIVGTGKDIQKMF